LELKIIKKSKVPSYWKMVIMLNNNGTLGVVDVPCDTKSCQFIAFPKSAQVDLRREEKIVKPLILSIESKIGKKTDKHDDGGGGDFFSMIETKLEVPKIDKKNFEDEKMRMLNEMKKKRNEVNLNCKILRFKDDKIESTIVKYKPLASDINKSVENGLCITKGVSTQVCYPHTRIIIE